MWNIYSILVEALNPRQISPITRGDLTWKADS